MRLPDSNSRQGRELEIKLTPMIDVVFLLLVFFIWNLDWGRLAASIRGIIVSVVAGVVAEHLGTIVHLSTALRPHGHTARRTDSGAD